MILIKNVINFILHRFPNIKINLRIAHMKESSYHFVQKSLVGAMYISATFSLSMFMVMDKFRGRELIKANALITLAIFAAGFLLVFLFLLNAPSVYIRKRQSEIDKEVLFAGRYLLVKMQSGVPFFNALTDASQSYGVSSKYFKEIVDDIQMGTPIEDALDKAVEYNASHKFKMILWQMTNALKTGIDTTGSLKAVLDEITKEQVIEIKRYGKKLNSLAMFYMLIGVVVPSLGMAMFIIVTSFVSIQIKLTHLMIIVLMLAFMQFMFLSMFKSIRPNVNL
ncbi:type II secretion system F family protein [Candidatus Woesearchaeota archaeon]|nr:type II secretion system F family protein [Candidatus Woesearchaeota archaeon]